MRWMGPWSTPGLGWCSRLAEMSWRDGNLVVTHLSTAAHRPRKCQSVLIASNRANHDK